MDPHLMARTNSFEEATITDPYQNAYSSSVLKFRAPGLVYNERMIEHKCIWDESYPECPARFTCVNDRMKSMGLFKSLQHVESRMATESEILTLHTPELLAKLQATPTLQPVDLEELSSNFDAIYINQQTYELAMLAAGSTIELVDRICMDDIPSGFALVRPPGHHAMNDEYCGYCFFNNAALAAKHALDVRGVKKILIVDWDVHHGQATQQMFYDDKRVVYFSIHRYEHGTFWPNLRESDYDSIGSGAGAGYNFNVPLNKTGMCNADYLAIFHNLLIPVANEFQPELIIISAGFDAALGCPEGEMNITPACYAHLLWLLKNLASGHIAVVLEGGYCLSSLAEGAALTARSLLGHPCPSLIDPLEAPCPEIVAAILNNIHAHQSYWNCFIQTQMKTGKEIELESNNWELYQPEPVKFLYLEEKPLTYQTRDCYPVQSKEFLDFVALELSRLRNSTNLTFAPDKVCFVYDPEMLKHDPNLFIHRVHPEDPSRVEAVFQKFLEFDLPKFCKRVNSRKITKKDLSLIHPAAFVDEIQKISEGSQIEQKIAELKYNSVSFNEHSYESACLAAGSLLQVVDEVMTGLSQSGVAIIRPPGHHASHDKAHGFCFFNNVAVAAKYALTKYSLDRILIIDWDVHHGNGTQEIFYDDDRFLYISLHVFNNGKFFPNLECGGPTFVGENKGVGFNVNIPWENHGTSDADYLTAFYNIILPISYQFNPQLVIVSAGFDAAIHDMIGKCHVTPEAFGHFTHYLSALANGKIILALEGGYNKESVAIAMTICTKTLLQDPLPFLKPKFDALKEAQVMKRVIDIQSKFWSCLKCNRIITKQLD